MKGNGMSRKKVLLVVAIALALAAGLIYSAHNVWVQSAEYIGGSSAYSTLNEYISLDKDRAGGGSPASDSGRASGKEADIAPDAPDASGKEVIQPAHAAEREYDYPGIVWPDVDFARLRQINPDIVGWLYAEGMNLSYPVVQAGDNGKYLDTMFDGTKNKTGCPFLDAGNASDFSDRHSVIYAHNRKDGSMFGRLKLYKEQEFCEQHPRILLITPDARYVMEIFSGHVARSDSGAWRIAFSDDAEFASWREVIRGRSSIHSDTLPEDGERILTLSTCSYEFENARYVVHGVLRKVKLPQ